MKKVFSLFYFFVTFVNSCSMNMNFVMTTNNSYVEPTAVAIQSLKNTSSHDGFTNTIIIFVYEVSGENQEKLKKFQDDKTKICLIDLNSPKFSEIMSECARIAPDGSYFNKLVCFHTFFPEIWQLCLEEVMKIKEFIYLDSDLIILKDIRLLYQECFQEKENQPIISANLNFFKQAGSSKEYDLLGGVGAIFSESLRGSPPTKPGYGMAEAHGGVVFWNMELILRDRIKFPHFDSDEYAFTSVLKDLKRKKIYFFSPEWNATPQDILSADKISLKLGRDKGEIEYERFLSTVATDTSDKIEREMFQPSTLDCLNKLASRDISIIHWDEHEKPWKKESCESDSWEARWWEIRKSLELTKIFPIRE
ncbi:MAG: hypothetical protein LBL99_03285 [Holosporaceae bacterium]|jgi:hypothetical protein|nr:hypothetical protein [Holosporaceae bacterium]